MNDKFDKTSLAAEATGSVAAASGSVASAGGGGSDFGGGDAVAAASAVGPTPAVPKYEKPKSFFDDFSSHPIAPAGQGRDGSGADGGRPKRGMPVEQRRALDMETFGETAPN
eukprot:contig_28160_g6919